MAATISGQERKGESGNRGERQVPSALRDASASVQAAQPEHKQLNKRMCRKRPIKRQKWQSPAFSNSRGLGTPSRREGSSHFSPRDTILFERGPLTEEARSPPAKRHFGKALHSLSKSLHVCSTFPIAASLRVLTRESGPRRA